MLYLAYMRDLDPRDRRRSGTLCWKLSSSGGCFRPQAIHHSSQERHSHQVSTLPQKLEGRPVIATVSYHRKLEMGLGTHRSGFWVAQQAAVTASGGARVWTGVYREVTFSSPPYPSRSPIVRDGEGYCGTGGLFPACGLGWYWFSGTGICEQGWPARRVSRFFMLSSSPVAPNRERTVVCDCECPGGLSRHCAQRRCDRHGEGHYLAFGRKGLHPGRRERRVEAPRTYRVEGFIPPETGFSAGRHIAASASV